MPDPHLARITRYPVKSLDGETVSSVDLHPETGAIIGDREIAIVDASGEYVNGKRTAAVHRISASYDSDCVELTVPGQGTFEFGENGKMERLERALSDYFGYSVRFIRETEGGLPDDTAVSGPTVISTGTLEEVASWFQDIDTDEMRRRFRANIEIGGVPAFWEDRLFTDFGRVVRFQIGDVHFDGVSPCARCVVPARDPNTGEERRNFQRDFVAGRKDTMPPWLESDRFDHPYRLMVNTDLARDSPSTTLATGDPVNIIGERPANRA